MYCENCHILFDGKRCTVCGSKNVWEPEPGDYCCFTEKELVWADALEDLLKQNGVPYVAEYARGAWLSANLGQAWERKRFYVPYAYYETARALEQDFFSSEFSFEEDSEENGNQ